MIVRRRTALASKTAGLTNMKSPFRQPSENEEDFDAMLSVSERRFGAQTVVMKKIETTEQRAARAKAALAAGMKPTFPVRWA